MSWNPGLYLLMLTFFNIPGEHFTPKLHLTEELSVRYWSLTWFRALRWKRQLAASNTLQLVQSANNWLLHTNT